MIRAFIKDSVTYTLPTLFSRALSFFLIPLYTRVLSPRDYGALDLLIVFASIVHLTIALEVSQGVARYYAGEADTDRKVLYASSSFLFTIFCYSIFAALALCFAPYLAYYVMGEVGMERVFRIGIGFIWINGLFHLIQNQFRWELRSREYAIVSLFMSCITAALSVMFAFWLRWGLEGMLLGLLIGNLSGTFLGLWRLKTSFRFRFDIGCLHEMLAFSAPLVISGVAVWISLYVDRLMINRLLSLEAVGLYGVGYRVASIAGLAMVGFQGALTPLIYSHHQDSSTPGQLSVIFRFSILFALFVSLVLVLFAQDIFRLLTTDLFFSGAVVVGYLAPAILLSKMYIFAPGISISKKTHLTIWINMAGAILNILLNSVLIPVYGIIGAGVATMISSLFVFLAYMIISQRLYPVPHQWKQIISAVAFAFLVGWSGSIFDVNDLLRWIVNCALIMLFLAACFLFRLVHYYELRHGSAVIKNMLWPY